jgi:acyl-CoA reductase-like NAD-dependent aldehyde dehydrogenase
LGKALMRAWGGLDFRLKLLRQLIEIYQSKIDEMADTISQEMGAPRSLARKAQAPAGLCRLIFGVASRHEQRYNPASNSRVSAGVASSPLAVDIPELSSKPGALRQSP